MLVATKSGFWSNAYDIAVDGRPLTRWSRSFWKSGGTFMLDGQPYSVRANAWGTKFELSDARGAVLAGAQRVGRKRWTVTSGGRQYDFQRASAWRSDQLLMSGGQAVGSIRRTSAWSGRAEAQLPGLALVVQVFVLAVVLTMWANNQAAAAAST